MRKALGPSVVVAMLAVGVDEDMGTANADAAGSAAIDAKKTSNDKRYRSDCVAALGCSISSAALVTI